MSKYFDTVREPITINARGKSHTFFIREIGYLRLMEILTATGIGKDAKERGVAIMEEIAMSCIEDKDGKPAYSREDWKDEIKEVFEQLSNAAMKAQGVDVESKAKPMTEEESEGNE